MLLKLYELLSTASAIWVRSLLRYRVKQSKEDPARIWERYAIAGKPRPEGKLIWVHAASVGEAQSTITMIHRILDTHKDISILATTGTVTSAKVMAQRLPEQAIHQYFPLDILSYVESFLNHWQPDLVLWVESELWPNMLTRIAKHNIPAILINGRLSAKTYTAWKWAKPLMQRMLKTFKIIFVQSQLQQQRFATFSKGDIRVCGNIKFAARPLPVDPNKLLELQSQIKDRLVWLAASTHEGEEAIIAEAHRQILQEHPQALCILLPRHPLRAPDIIPLFADQNLAQRSKNEKIEASTQVYLADTIGEAGLFYKFAPIALIGGSLVPIGGHNLVEPAQLDCVILHGPYMHKTKEIAQAFADHSACVQVNDAENLAKVICGLLNAPQLCEEMLHQARHVVDLNAKCLDNILSEVDKLL